MRGFRQWRWHLGEVYVKVNGEMRYLWRPVGYLDPHGAERVEVAQPLT